MKRIALLAGGLLLFFSCEDNPIAKQDAIAEVSGDWMLYKRTRQMYHGDDTLTGTINGEPDVSEYNSDNSPGGLSIYNDTIIKYYNDAFKNEDKGFLPHLIKEIYTDLTIDNNGDISGVIKDSLGKIVVDYTIGKLNLDGDVLSRLSIHKSPFSENDFVVVNSIYRSSLLPLPWWEDSIKIKMK